jgi:hypothetical protein
MALGPVFLLSSGVPASLARERSWRSGDYLTDRKRLYRVLSPLSRPWRRGIAVLEDCRTLTIGAYRAEDLWHMALRRVDFDGDDAIRIMRSSSPASDTTPARARTASHPAGSPG